MCWFLRRHRRFVVSEVCSHEHAIAAHGDRMTRLFLRARFCAISFSCFYSECSRLKKYPKFEASSGKGGNSSKGWVG
jgi:hypothetical protein